MRKLRSLAKVSYAAPDVLTAPIPVPTEGWDAISPLAAMDPKRAPILVNWVPRTGWVELRPGSGVYATTAVDEPTESLVVWRGPVQQKMFAAVLGSIYDVSAASGTPPAVVTGKSSARWQYVNFNNAAGVAVVQLVNGLDALLQYDGTTWTVPTITGLPSGVTTASFVNINAHKRRLWYVVKQSTLAVFMPTDAISGAAAGSLDLGPLFTLGGYLVATANWTLDGGNGPDDYMAFVSSRGQIAVYRGVDPTDATTWTVVGTFTSSPPIGYRCTTQVGSDVALITLQGVLPLSQVLPFTPAADRSVAITARIQNAMLSAAQSASGQFGWEFTLFPAQALGFLNVPLVAGSQQQQYVTNMITGAWCKFVGWEANCFALYNEELYFGDNSGDVVRAYVGSADSGAPIQYDMQCAFNYFGDAGRNKRMTMIQPLMVAGGTLTPTLEVDADFSSGEATAAPISILGADVLWDVAVWDVSAWPEATQTLTDWYSADGLGHALAVRMKLTLGTEVASSSAFDTATFDTSVFDGGAGDDVLLQINAFNAIVELGSYV